MKRLRRLEKNSVITRYTIVLNHSLIGQTHYRVLFHLNSCSRAELDAFYASCQKSAHVTYGIKSLGEWDYEVDIEVPSVEEYRATIRALTREHAGIIREYDTLAISKIHKYNLFPG